MVFTKPEGFISATSIIEGFKHTTWVVKKYTDQTKEILKDMKQTEKAHIFCAHRNFACQLKEKVAKENLLDFGEVFEFNKVFMGITGQW